MSSDVNSQEVVASADNQTNQTAQQGHFEKLRRKTEALEQELQKRDAMLQQQQEALNQLQSRFAPQDRDDFDSMPGDELIDKAKMQRIREKDRESYRKEAEAIARQTYAKIDNENYQQKLYQAFPDYDQVVNAANAEKLQEKDPEFVSLLGEVKDEYKRREMAYKKMKKIAQTEEKPRVKAQEVVEENRKASGSFYSPGGQGPSANPYAFEFDVRNAESRTKAYERLKAAQKRAF